MEGDCSDADANADAKVEAEDEEEGCDVGKADEEEHDDQDDAQEGRESEEEGKEAGAGLVSAPAAPGSIERSTKGAVCSTRGRVCCSGRSPPSRPARSVATRCPARSGFARARASRRGFREENMVY